MKPETGPKRTKDTMKSSLGFPWSVSVFKLPETEYYEAVFIVSGVSYGLACGDKGRCLRVAERYLRKLDRLAANGVIARWGVVVHNE